MKILGTVFLLIALGLAAHGWNETKYDCMLSLQIRLKDSELERNQDYERTLAAIAQNSLAELTRVHDSDMAEKARQAILNRAMDEPGAAIRMVDMMAEGKNRTTESERQLEKLKADRDEKMKWSYVPASILAALGLILLVYPQPQKSTK